ncbi:MAG: hydrolase [Candidatus Kapaibacterium sp.]
MINTTDRSDTILVVIDVQERMMPAIRKSEQVIDNIGRLIRGCQELKVPVLVTEQYPKGLGATVAELREILGDAYNPLEKMTFSAAKDHGFMQAFEASGRHQILICGVETHVCVYQTARDLHNLGWTVEVVADAVASRVRRNREVALTRMEHHGIDFTTVEMALFDMMESAEIPEFKAISAIVK